MRVLCGEKKKKKRDRKEKKKRERVQQQWSRVDKDCVEMWARTIWWVKLLGKEKEGES